MKETSKWKATGAAIIFIILIIVFYEMGKSSNVTIKETPLERKKSFPVVHSLEQGYGVVFDLGSSGFWKNKN